MGTLSSRFARGGHTRQHAVPNDIVVEQRRRRVETGQYQQKVRRKTVPMGNRFAHVPIADLREAHEIEEIVSSNEALTTPSTTTTSNKR